MSPPDKPLEPNWLAEQLKRSQETYDELPQWMKDAWHWEGWK
jgi:hypothetical protein